MYYIIETNYVGPNQYQDNYTNQDIITITTSPAINNGNREEQTAGWCGTTNNWAVYAHGEYPTIEEARDAMIEILGDVRGCDANGRHYEAAPIDDHIVEVYRPGKYETMSLDASKDWAWEGISADITADTTDERIAELARGYEIEANSQGCTLDPRLDSYMRDYRQELADEEA